MKAFSGILLVLLVAGAHGACPPNYVDIMGQCFYFMSYVGQTHERATQECITQGGQLARIKSCDVLGAVAEYAATTAAITGFWLGAEDSVIEGSFYWNDGTPVTMGAPFWGGVDAGLEEPQLGDGDSCVAMDYQDGYYFHNYACSNPYSMICQQDGTTCTAPFELIGGGCYDVVHSAAASWADAQAYCQSQGGYLAILDDCNSISPIIAEIESTGTSLNNYWIGGVSPGGETWDWIDGTEMALGVPFWGRFQTDGLQPDGGPAENCAALLKVDRFYMHDADCNTLISPLCEADPIA